MKNICWLSTELKFFFIGCFLSEILIFSSMAYISVVNSHLVDTNSTLKLVWLHTYYRKPYTALYWPGGGLPRSLCCQPWLLLLHLVMFGFIYKHLKRNLKSIVNYCIEGTMTLTCSVTCVSSCLPVRRGTPPAPPATRHLSRVVRYWILKVILEMLDLFNFVYNLSPEGFKLYDR